MGKLFLTGFFLAVFAAWVIYFSTKEQRSLFVKYFGKISLVAILGGGLTAFLYALLTM
jgi:hypothetical protein